MKSLRCWMGWHAWLRMNASRMTVGDRVVDRLCTRCGLTEFWE